MLRISLFALLVGMFVLGCTEEKRQRETSKAQKVEESEDKPANLKNMVFFGNSLTAGYGLDIDEAFPARIQDILDSLGYAYNVVNAGLSGETTASGNSRVEWVLSNRVDVFVLELGANDGLRGIKPAETTKNLQEIIDKVWAKYPEATIVLAGMMVPPNMGERYASEFQNIFQEISRTNDIPLIPFLLQDVAGEPTLNLEDGIHPTPEGHEIVAQNVWTVLKEVI